MDEIQKSLEAVAALQECINTVSYYHAGMDYYNNPQSVKDAEKAAAEAAKKEGAEHVKNILPEHHHLISWGLSSINDFK